MSWPELLRPSSTFSSVSFFFAECLIRVRASFFCWSYDFLFNLKPRLKGNQAESNIPKPSGEVWVEALTYSQPLPYLPFFFFYPSGSSLPSQRAYGGCYQRAELASDFLGAAYGRPCEPGLGWGGILVLGAVVMD